MSFKEKVVGKLETMVKRESTNWFGSHFNRKVAEKAWDILQEEMKEKDRVEKYALGIPVQNKITEEIILIDHFVKDMVSGGEWMTVRDISDYLSPHSKSGKVNVYKLGNELTRREFPKKRATVDGATRTVYRVFLKGWHD